MLNWSRYTIAAAAASEPAMAKVMEIVRLTLIPIIAAASGSWATARIALPWRVYVTNHVSSASTGSVMTTIASLFQEKLTPNSEKASERGMKFGTEWKFTL